MDIDESNQIIKSVIHFNMNNKVKQVKQIEEFGFFNYCMGFEQTESTIKIYSSNLRFN